MNEAEDYGFGLFETIRFQNSKPQDLKGHYDRLKSSADDLGIQFVKSLADFGDEVETAIESNQMAVGAVRYQLSKDGDESSIKIAVRGNRYTKDMYQSGFKLKLSEVRKSSSGVLIGYKSVNYLENLLVLRKAKADGYDEALYLNEKGHITEGSYTNIFFIKDDFVYTPEPEAGLLKGTMRSQVIVCLNQSGINCSEGGYAVSDILEADAVFVTNALMGVMPVRSIETETKHTEVFDIDHRLIRKLSDQLMADWIF